MVRMKRCMIAALMVVGLAANEAAWAQAQTFPNHRMTILVSSTAGGSLDTMARLLAEFLKKKYDQAVIVDDRPGAADIPAMTPLLAAPADGHSLAFAGNQHIGLLFIKDMPYDVNSFTPVSILNQTPYALVASKGSGFRNIKDMVAWAKANPGKLTMGAVTGVHTLNQYQAAAALGFEPNVILYKGFAPLETAVLSNEVNVSVFGNIGKVKTGQITGLVTAGDQRNADIPDVPTYKELGITFDQRASYTVWTRSAVPADILDKLTKDCQELVRTPEYSTRVTNGLGIPAIGSTREFAVKYFVQEYQDLKATADRIGLKPQ